VADATDLLLAVQAVRSKKSVSGITDISVIPDTDFRVLLNSQLAARSLVDLQQRWL
jgi:hypothetical protein